MEEKKLEGVVKDVKIGYRNVREDTKYNKDKEFFPEYRIVESRFNANPLTCRSCSCRDCC